MSPELTSIQSAVTVGMGSNHVVTNWADTTKEAISEVFSLKEDYVIKVSTIHKLVI